MMKNKTIQFSLIFGLLVLLISACAPAAGNSADAQSGGGSGEDLQAADGVVWQLVEYGPEGAMQPVLADTQVTLKFDFSQHTLGGSAGCNSYSGEFDLSGSSLTTGPIMSTMMACLQDGVMEQEQAVSGLLDTLSGYQLSGDQLVLIAEGGQLIFTRQ